mmetsp:Transcript_23228/g.64894  ORF Transcript_23228/g.64894 Transcript_23228/m.64894 type:complete len:235 (-) Transcript_23228:21-725(-)
MEELLHKHRRALDADFVLRGHEELEVLLHLLLGVAELDAIGARGLNGLDHHGHRLALDEGADVDPPRPAGLAHGAQTPCLYELLLDFLVAPLRNGRAIRPEPQLLREEVGERHTRLAADDARDQLELTDRQSQRRSGVLYSVLLPHLRDVLHVLATLWDVGFEVIADVLRPHSSERVSTGGDLCRDISARRNRVNDRDAVHGHLLATPWPELLRARRRGKGKGAGQNGAWAKKA